MVFNTMTHRLMLCYYKKAKKAVISSHLGLDSQGKSMLNSRIDSKNPSQRLMP